MNFLMCAFNNKYILTCNNLNALSHSYWHTFYYRLVIPRRIRDSCNFFADIDIS